MVKLVYYCPYLGLEHLMLIRRGWQEHHCLFIDNEVWIKVSKHELVG